MNLFPAFPYSFLFVIFYIGILHLSTFGYCPSQFESVDHHYIVAYFCIIFESMHSIFALPRWRHKCIFMELGWGVDEGST